jgi:hypothetical protein
LVPWALATPLPEAAVNRRFLVLFFKKELLAFSRNVPR